MCDCVSFLFRIKRNNFRLFFFVNTTTEDSACSLHPWKQSSFLCFPFTRQVQFWNVFFRLLALACNLNVETIYGGSVTHRAPRVHGKWIYSLRVSINQPSANNTSNFLRFHWQTPSPRVCFSSRASGGRRYFKMLKKTRDSRKLLRQTKLN